MQANPPRANSAAASSDIRVAGAFDLRAVSIATMICIHGKRQVTAFTLSERDQYPALGFELAHDLIAPPVTPSVRRACEGAEALVATSAWRFRATWALETL